LLAWTDFNKCALKILFQHALPNLRQADVLTEQFRIPEKRSPTHYCAKGTILGSCSSLFDRNAEIIAHPEKFSDSKTDGVAESKYLGVEQVFLKNSLLKVLISSAMNNVTLRPKFGSENWFSHSENKIMMLRN
jgi:hypothetical protein